MRPELPSYAIGVAAVEMFLEWRKNGVVPFDRVLPPLRVIHRQTTGLSSISDDKVRHALEYIREKASEQIEVSDVVQHVGGLSRRRLEERFHAVVGYGIGEEILKTKLARAQQLLASPALSIKEVAFLSGFSSPQRFCSIFRLKSDCTPGTYRSRSGCDAGSL